jgi:flagellar biosynthesis regulator FlbT
MTILRQLVYYVAQKVVANPEAREKAAEAARAVIQKTKQIAKENDRAYAAGRAVRKALDKLR